MGKPVILCEAPREFYRPILLAEGERYIRPHGNCDVSVVSQDTSVIVCMWSAESNWMPQHLDKVDCPKVLMIGDTHHGFTPLTKTVRMAVNEPWDMVCLEFNRQHCHWFAEADAENVQWIPCWHITPHRTEPQPNKVWDVCMVGNTHCHPYRRRVLAELAKAGINVYQCTASPETAAKIYNRSRISLNVSLNGDFNLRNFEVVAAGGCVMNDRLSSYSGQSELEWEFACDSIAKFVDMCHNVLHTYPEFAEDHARASYDRFWSTHSPSHKISAFWRGLEGAKTWEDDRRQPGDLWNRIAKYEEAQELRRVTGKVPDWAIGPDFADLYPLDMAETAC